MNFHDRYHQNNNNFTEKMAAKFSNTIDAIINHPYISALEKEEISRETLEVFVCEQYQIIANDRKNFAFIISKASDEISTGLFFDCLSAEVKALKNLVLMAEELGISKDKIESYEPLAGCHAYTNYLTRLAVYGSDAEILAAIIVDFPVWGANCSKISSFLKKGYGFTDSSCIFLDQFATPLPKEFIEKSNDLISSNLPGKEKEIQRATRFILDYEL
jgi:pyrroloquinoline quinone (PQQ) biosynthesis protein C